MAFRHLDGQLIVEHALVEIALVAAEIRVLEVRIAHALEHHAGEQALELARRLADRLRILGLGGLLERVEAFDVGVDAGIGDGGGHMTSDHDELCAQGAGLLERFQNGNQIAWSRAHLVHGADDFIQIHARVEDEHAAFAFLDIDGAARRSDRRAGAERIRLARVASLGDRDR